MTVETAAAPVATGRRPIVVGAAAILVVVLAAGAAFLALKVPADRAARLFAHDASAHVERVLALVGTPHAAIAAIDTGRVPAPRVATGVGLSGVHRTVSALVPRYDAGLDALRDGLAAAVAAPADAPPPDLAPQTTALADVRAALLSAV
ncbi:hypothetical protein LFM56_01580 [Cellulomonas iranensis]|uniref:hypothetical protein n=2 Tax=Cellulomonas iranensis TaxID=76862 RepID=UPI001CF365DA|nr:hypothetical protein [Cellulomonas iranensis]UCN15046.1 hypothetical protein LFM56_01580 [Cellulomonas iranensis]